jgi:hypothetical protein
MWEPRPLTPQWAFTACYRDSFTYLPFVLRFLFNLWSELSSWYGVLAYCQLRIDEYGALGGMKISSGNRSSRRKPAHLYFDKVQYTAVDRVTLSTINPT